MTGGNNNMDPNEILETKTNHWYYLEIGVAILIIVMIPVILFSDNIINFFTK